MRLHADTATLKNQAIAHALDLSESRAYDCALEILEAYKLTGNFHVNLEVVLKDLGALDEVSFEIEPKSYLAHHPDCRHVAFSPRPGVHADRFAEILRSLKDRIGLDSTHSWWSRAFH
ncbi:MAG TPA: hypothetical protein VH934_05755 [Xanthobacteraceae bacterium]|jgi:hypothetical protein